ncbi:MAG: Gfo/Idh/MocA family oxidoreductase, partial [Gemmataceae bacterium]
AEFIPIYQAHPNAEMYAICQRSKDKLDACGDKFGIKKRYTSYEDLLKDPNVDAVHINSPIPDHGPQTLAALKAGKHVACTVPMATSKEQIREIVELQRKVNKTYMMMEMVVYAREYLFAEDIVEEDRPRHRRIRAGLVFIESYRTLPLLAWPRLLIDTM